MPLTLHTQELTLTTPAVLFWAVSLIMLAFTSRFIAYTQLVRNLKDRYDNDKKPTILAQIKTLQKRLKLLRIMQIIGISSLCLCVLSMFLIYISFTLIAAYIFGLSLVLLVVSLCLSIWEIQISSKSLHLHLHDIEK
jgi:hypothetical protein